MYPRHSQEGLGAGFGYQWLAGLVSRVYTAGILLWGGGCWWETPCWHINLWLYLCTRYSYTYTTIIVIGLRLLFISLLSLLYMHTYTQTYTSPPPHTPHTHTQVQVSLQKPTEQSDDAHTLMPSQYYYSRTIESFPLKPVP